MVYTVKSADTHSGQRFTAKVDSILLEDDPKRVAFDCEGVSLSRMGTLEIVSICFEDMKVFLIDFGDNPCPRIVTSVKDLFESKDVTKIIHDCRKDCDALYHHHGIKVRNVHDISCFHDIISRTENKNLNSVLQFNGINPNSVRDNSVYKYNPRFWAARPLTKKMIDWASSDVDKLIALADEQLSGIRSTSKNKALIKSTKYSRLICKMKVCSGLSVNSPGLFIGPGGRDIKSLEKRTGTLIYQDSSNRGSWYVYYDDEASLRTVTHRMAM